MPRSTTLFLALLFFTALSAHTTKAAPISIFNHIGTVVLPDNSRLLSTDSTAPQDDSLVLRALDSSLINRNPLPIRSISETVEEACRQQGGTPVLSKRDDDDIPTMTCTMDPDFSGRKIIQRAGSKARSYNSDQEPLDEMRAAACRKNGDTPVRDRVTGTIICTSDPDPGYERGVVRHIVQESVYTSRGRK